MDLMDLLARYAEFFSPESIAKCLNSFKNMYSHEDIAQRNSYIKANHKSASILTVGNLIKHVYGRFKSEDVSGRLTILLSIYEPLLINDVNLEKAVLPNE